MKAITIFCGSSSGFAPVYLEQARLLGKTLAERGIDVVYGGARVGLMGALADGALQAGGAVTGVLPAFLKAKEIAHEGLTNLILTDSMHERKMKMNELSDGVIALPGGFGTLEELFEMLTWGQLGLHKKPVAILNASGFYDPLIALIDTMVERGFLKPDNRDMLLISNDIEELLEKMMNYRPPETGKWISPATT